MLSRSAKRSIAGKVRQVQRLSGSSQSICRTGYPAVAASEPTLPSMNVLQSHVLLGALLLQGIGLVELFKPIREQKSNKLDNDPDNSSSSRTVPHC